VGSVELQLMPVVRFVREGCEVVCPVGTNLRDLALAEGLQLYGLKGQLGNCGGCGQCITCFIEVVAVRHGSALSESTAVEEKKLRGRPSRWRLACQALVMDSVAVLTRPQVGRDSLTKKLDQAVQEPLPVDQLSDEL
jgi:ferredoxin